MKDVAAASGVSPATVSFVLNGTTGQVIREETRVRVRAAAEQLGYVPHGIARALREGASRVIVLDVGALPSGGSLASFIAGMSGELSAAGHVLLVHHGAEEELREVIGAVTPRAVVDVTRPFLPLDPANPDGGLAYGVAAHTRTQLRHLLDRGHRQLAFAVPADPGVQGFARARLDQASRVCEESGASAPLPVLVPRERSAAREVVARLQVEHPGVSAVAAFDDPVALTVLAAMSDLGLSAPRHLAVIGFDDSEAAPLWSPALTSVRIDAAAYGRRAARVALGRSDGEWPESPSVVVERQSA